MPLALAAAGRGRCPRCGTGALFAGLLTLAPTCSACGLNFTLFNLGDGPAAFVTASVGGLVVALALAVELVWEPPVWLHVALWLPLTFLLVIGGLRVAKGWLLASEWARDAREGRRL